MSAIATALSVLLLAASLARGWLVRFDGIVGEEGVMAVDSHGDVPVVAGIPFADVRRGAGVAVVKVGRGGRVLWRRRLRGRGRERNDFLHDLKIAANDDVVVGGEMENDGQVDFFAARIAGKDGRVRWRHALEGPDDSGLHSASAVAVDAADDVIAAGDVQGAPTAPVGDRADLLVAKFAGRTGDVLWRTQLDRGGARWMRLDSAGDPIVIGAFRSEPATIWSMLKLASADGHVVWRRDFAAPFDTRDLVFDANGDMIFAGSTDRVSNFGVARLSGSDGTLEWISSIAGTDSPFEAAYRAAVLPSGDVAAIGFVGVLSESPSLAVAVFDGAGGAVRWQRLLGDAQIVELARPIAVGPDGNLLVLAQLPESSSCHDAALLRLSAATGDVLEIPPLGRPGTARTCKTATGVVVDHEGRAIAAGGVSDGRHRFERGFVSAVPLVP